MKTKKKLRIKTVFNIFLILLVLLCLSSCRSQTSKQIDQAYEYLEKKELAKGKEILDKLIFSVDTANMDVYDRAYLGLAAIVFGIESSDVKLGVEGYKLATKAYKDNPDECEKMAKQEDYLEDGLSNYQDVMRFLSSSLNDLILTDKAVNRWSVQWTDYFLGERRNVTETLELRRDGTFKEYATFWIRETEGNYSVRAKANIESGGKWEIEDGVITMSYEVKDLVTDIPSESFKLSLSDAGFFSSNWLEYAFAGAMSDKQVLSELRKNLHDRAYNTYLNGTSTGRVKFNGSNMIFESSSRRREYIPKQD